jgi:hypothetical protein
MSTESHLVLTTIVTRAQWAADQQAVLLTARGTLRDRARQQGLQVRGEPTEDVQVLPGDTRVRITLSTGTVPADTAPAGTAPAD